MKPFDVYPLMPITPVKAFGAAVWDDKGTQYLDFYGGHAVISIGHSHPRYVNALKEQLDAIGFYSNAVQIPIQQEVAEKLGELSSYPDYRFFMCNSGAEAVENALKLASFQTKRNKIIAFSGSFHGRTSAAVAATDNPSIAAPINKHEVQILPLNDIEVFEKAMNSEVAAVIVEGIQGVAGIFEPKGEFLNALQKECKKYGALLVLDEVQSGCGRSGKYFAHQHHSGIQPDLITVAKGIGNGFPVGGVLIAPHLEAKHGMLGTTFGGNYLACAAMLAVLQGIEEEGLMARAALMGERLMSALKVMPGVKEVRGRGLMIGIDLEAEAAPIREKLLLENKIFTGNASKKSVIRLLPPLSITDNELDHCIESFSQQLHDFFG